MTHNSGDSGLCFEIWFRRRKTQDTYSLQANNREVKEAWAKDLERILWEQAVHNRGQSPLEEFLGQSNTSRCMRNQNIIVPNYVYNGMEMYQAQFAVVYILVQHHSS